MRSIISIWSTICTEYIFKESTLYLNNTVRPLDSYGHGGKNIEASPNFVPSLFTSGTFTCSKVIII